ncbi:M protein trans-acting positive regulator PRD domain-containing protein [Aerococcaceae bacterium WGS1372]
MTDFFELTTHANYIDLQFNNNQNIQTVYQYIIKNSDAFRLIEALLYNGSMSMEEMVNQLYLSRSTIYRILPTIRQSLKRQYRISINTTPLEFVGDESDIRFFLTQFIAKRYLNETLSLKHFNDKLLQELLIEIGYLLNTEVNYTTMNVIIQRVYTNYLRTKLGYDLLDVPVREDVIDHLLTTSTDAHRLLKDFYNKLQLPLNRENLINLFSDFILEGYYYSVDEMMNSLGDNPQTQKSYIKLSQLLNELSNLFNIPLETKDFLIYILHNTIQLYKHEVNSNYILFDRKGIFVEKTRDQFPKFTEESYKRLGQYLADMGIHDDADFTNHIYYTLVTHWENLSIHLTKVTTRIRALILSDFDIYHARMMQANLENSLVHYVDFSVYSNQILDYSFIDPTEFDLIIANFPLPSTTDTETVTINTFPSDDDVLRIFNLCHSIALNKLTSDKNSEQS